MTKEETYFKDVVEQLIGPLGFSMTYYNTEYPNKNAIILIDNNGKWVYMNCCDGETYGKYVCSSFEELVKLMLNEVETFYFPSPRSSLVDNPYYGCANIEEAMIKKDLAGM